MANGAYEGHMTNRKVRGSFFLLDQNKKIKIKNKQFSGRKKRKRRRKGEKGKEKKRKEKKDKKMKKGKKMRKSKREEEDPFVEEKRKKRALILGVLIVGSR